MTHTRWKVRPDEVPAELRENFIARYLVGLSPEDEASMERGARMDHARTCWAEDTGLDAEMIEALTLISEEASARGLEVVLPARDVWSEWPVELERVGADDLAAEVRELFTEWSERT